jgi:hypothetical protein
MVTPARPMVAAVPPKVDETVWTAVELEVLMIVKRWPGIGAGSAYACAAVDVICTVPEPGRVDAVDAVKIASA